MKSTSTAPPASRSPLPQPAARFMVARDGRGVWIVHDRLGRVGGLFASEQAAVHFAAEECNHDPAGICRMPDGSLPDLGSELRPQRRN